MAGGTTQLMHLGQNIIVVGLCIQLLSFGIFLVASIVFYQRIKRTTHLIQQPQGKQTLHWRTLLYALYAASILILIRSIFRIVEYLNGNDGFIQRHEVFAYVFDGVLMFAVMALFNSFHPGLIISDNASREWELQNCETNPEILTRCPPV